MDIKRSVSGYTLVEVMVSVAVAGILMSIAVPSMVDFVRGSRLTALNGQITADLQFARNEAIKRNSTVLVCASVGCTNPQGVWANGWYVCVDANDDGKCDDSTSLNPNPLRSRGQIEVGLTLVGPTTAVSYRPNGSQGLAGGATNTLTVSGIWSGAPRYVYTMYRTGVVSLAKT